MTTGLGESRLQGLRVLYAVSAMGLGHVQRSIPLIRHLLHQGAVVQVVSHGGALQALKVELEGEGRQRSPRPPLTFRSLPDYPPLQRGRGVAHYILYLRDLLEIWRTVRREEAFLRSIQVEDPVDLVVADGRFGFVHPEIPCLLVSHQIRVLLPRLFRPVQFISDAVQLRLLRRYRSVAVPDFPEAEHALAGSLAHNALARKLPVTYIGPLSTLDGPCGDGPKGESGKTQDTTEESEARMDYGEDEPPDSDVLVVMGGFIERERRRFVTDMMRVLRTRPEVRATLMLGGGRWEPASPKGDSNTRMEPLVLGPERRRLFSGARLWVGRTGYTTVMDLRAAGASGILVPTRGMTEQEYLARHLGHWGHAPPDETVDPLAREILEALPGAVYVDAHQWSGPLRDWTTVRSLGVFQQLLERLLWTDSP